VTTLPLLAARWGVKVNAVRSFLRRRPALQQELVTRVGPTFAFTPEAAAKLKEAFDSRPTAVKVPA